MNKGYLGWNETRDYDRDHEGHCGWFADQVLGRIDEWSAQANPDIVLMHIGTNDIGSGQSIPGIVDEVRQIIERLRARNPGVHVLLAAIIPAAQPHMRERIGEFNLELSALADMLDEDTSRVILVDQFTGVDDMIMQNLFDRHRRFPRWSVYEVANPATTATKKQISDGSVRAMISPVKP